MEDGDEEVIWGVKRGGVLGSENLIKAWTLPLIGRVLISGLYSGLYLWI